MVSLKHPPFVHWEVTPECNHNCIHCYNYWRKDIERLEGMRTTFSEEHYLAIARKLIEQKAHTVVITGGEPLLVFPKVKGAISLLKANGINISVNTNAVLLSDEIIDFIAKNGISLFISFPCHEESVCDFITNRVGSLKRILEILDVLTKRKVRFSLNIVVSKANIDYLQSSIDFLRERYEIKKIYVTRVGKPVNADLTFDKYLLSYEDLCKVQDICVKTRFEYGIEVDTGCPYTLCSINSQKSFELFGYKKICTAGKTSYAMDTYGNIKACPRDSKTYGNIFEEDFSVIWEKMMEWRNGDFLPNECKNCNVKDICKGGCRVDALPFTGRRDSMDMTARLENIPVKYTKIDETPQYSDKDIFLVNHLKIVEEDFGYRISCKVPYIFVTEELLNFLSSNSSFTLQSIMKGFSVNCITANNIISRLIKNGIVYIERR